MFDLQDDSTTRRKPDSPEGRMAVESYGGEPKEQPQNALDDERHTQLHCRLMGFYRTELARQEANRAEQEKDEAYYDHEQWTEEEKAVLAERGQAAIVYNVTHNTVNWVIGSEKRNRTDGKVMPRGKEDGKVAEAKSKYMKYLSDVNRAEHQKSRAFEDTVKVGIGWLESYVNDSDDDEPIRRRYENWRNMLWDSSGTELDGSDGRYQFRSKWVDEDIANMLGEGRADVIKNAVMQSNNYGGFDMIDGDMAMDQIENEHSDAVSNGTANEYARRRVRLIEAWYRVPANVKVLRGGMFNGEDYDETHEGHKASVAGGEAQIVSRGKMLMRVALMTTTGLLYDGPTPFKHNRFKFVPIWGYRKGKNNLPYGLIRGIRPIQDAVNKRASKALHILSTNKVLYEEGAIPDSMTQDEFAEEANRPDGLIAYRKGYKVELNVDRNLGAEHMSQMSVDVGMIQQVGGVTDELLGKDTNATSGKAIIARQEQGSVATNKMFDNLRMASQMVGELELSLIEQYVTEEKQFRITNMRGVPEFVTVNDGLPENDITRSKADYIISEVAWNATMRAAQVEALIDLAAKMPPEVVMLILDLIVDSMDDIENREEIVKRIRAASGQKDPDQTEPTPEDIAAQQAQAQQQQLQMLQVQLAMDEQAAKTDKVKAETARINKQALSDSMLAAVNAMTAAQAVVATPTIAKIGDALLNQAGWKGAHVAAAGLQPQQPAMQPPQQAPMPAQSGQPQ